MLLIISLQSGKPYIKNGCIRQSLASVATHEGCWSLYVSFRVVFRSQETGGR